MHAPEIPILRIPLESSPEARWSPLSDYRPATTELLAAFEDELQVADAVPEQLVEAVRSRIPAPTRSRSRWVARHSPSTHPTARFTPGISIGGPKTCSRNTR